MNSWYLVVLIFLPVVGALVQELVDLAFYGTYRPQRGTLYHYRIT